MERRWCEWEEARAGDAGRGNPEPSWLRDIKPPKLENLVGARVEQSEQAGYKNTLKSEYFSR